ncbi:hypothetical protein EI90DRAFT_3024204 [Cantharellus anzutake]|nr:hypothetical protein EI90DRAFT_3024204 [Cantharellus anzutake]
MPALKLAYLAHDLSDGLLSHDLVDVIDSWVGIASAACSVHPVYVPRIGREQWRSNSATQQSMEYIGFDSKPHFASHCVMATKVNDQDHIPDKFKTADFSANGCNSNDAVSCELLGYMCLNEMGLQGGIRRSLELEERKEKRTTAVRIPM